MSLEYVKKKADTRAGKTVEEPKAKEVVEQKNYTYKTTKETINGLEVPVKQIYNANGELLAEVRLNPRGEDFDVRLDNYGIEKGAARKALAEIMQEYPDKKFHWEAINENSLKSYKHFVEEYPKLAERVRFFDGSGEGSIDENMRINYNNSQKGVVDEARSNSSELGRGSEQDLSGTSQENSRQNDRQNTDYDEFGIPISSRVRDREYGSNRVSNDEASTSNNHQQKLEEHTQRGNEAEVRGNTSDNSRPISERIIFINTFCHSRATLGNIDY